MRVLKQILVIAIVGAGLLGSGCIRKVRVPEHLAVQPALSIDQLVSRINSYQQIDSFSAQVEVSVRDYYTKENGTAKDFPSANGALRLARPEKIRMLITAPIINSNVADMTSDGNKFSVAIYYPKDSRTFVHGTNPKRLRHLGEEEIKEAKDSRLRDAGALANIRPQHITDAFIIKPILSDESTVYFREEAQEREPDTRPGKSGREVYRTYYVLYVLERVDGGQLHLRRKFWFDETQGGTPLVRQQTFENGDGRVGSDIRYNDFFQIPNFNLAMPGSVEIKRPYDGYDISLVLNHSSVQINLTLPPTTFTLENIYHMKEIDLDQARTESITADKVSANRRLR
ncbi:MAG TPA: hypothetical protein VJX67_10210 [Blastocatellia bacterium]|nr:hypothetical protein [Blastocatellia bacterium]